MFRRSGITTIEDKLTNRWFGIFVVAALFSVPLAAAAQCNTIWDASGKWSFRQTNLKVPVDLDLRQNGKAVSGSASYILPGSSGSFGERRVGTVDGTVLGDRLSITISWAGGAEGVYDARILASGKLEGEGYDKRSPNIRQAWSSIGVLKCPPTPAPRQNQSSSVSPSNSGSSKPKPKPATPPAKPKAAEPPPIKPPGIVASRPIFITPAHPTGLVVLTWDAGPDHPYAEIWYKIGEAADPARLLEKGKGSIQLELTRNRYYTYILTDAGEDLAKVSFVVQ